MPRLRGKFSAYVPRQIANFMRCIALCHTDLAPGIQAAQWTDTPNYSETWRRKRMLRAINQAQCRGTRNSINYVKANKELKALMIVTCIGSE